MFLTVTANAALDRILTIPRFAPTTTMRVAQAVDAVGGKGYDVSVALRCLGQETLAVGFLAGEHGRRLESLVVRYGVRLDPVWVEGDTRIAHVIVETERQRHSHIISGGYCVRPEACAALLDRCRDGLAGARWVVAAGSLPEGVPAELYRDLTALAHERGVPVLIDSVGDPVRRALPARPDIVKMNWAEFDATFAAHTTSRAGLLQAARRVAQEHDLAGLVITGGRQGLLALTPAEAFWARGPRLVAVNAAGAGDAVSACLVWRLSLGEPWTEALRWATAAGAATVLTRATAECDWQAMQELYGRVRVRRLPG